MAYRWGGDFLGISCQSEKNCSTVQFILRENFHKKVETFLNNFLLWKNQKYLGEKKSRFLIK